MCILLLSSLVTSSISEDQEIFYKTFGGNKSDGGHSIQQTSDGGFIIVGGTKSIGAGHKDVWLVKTDESGNIQWDKTYGGKDMESGESVQQTSDGGFIIVGWTESYGIEGVTDSIYLRRDVWLIKTDNFGNMEWDMTYGGNDEDYGYSVHQTFDGGYIIGGETNSYGSGNNDIWLIKTDSSGKEEWKKTFGSGNTDFLGTIQETSDNGYIIVGSQGPDTNIDTFYNLWLIKVDSKGKEEWNRTYGENDAMGNFIQQTLDGGYVIIGSKNDNAWLIKTNNTGVMEWNKTYRKIDDEKGYSVRLTSDGGYILLNNVFYSVYLDKGDSKVGNIKIRIVKTDSSGTKLWDTSISEKNKKYFGYSIIETSDGGYVVVGIIEPLNGINSDGLLIKTDSKGNSIIPSKEKKDENKFFGFKQILILIIVMIFVIIFIILYRKIKSKPSSKSTYKKI
jgi:hypothetical protein